MKFIVYEDEPFFYELIKREIEALSIELDLEFDVVYAENMEMLLELNQEGVNFNILDLVHENGNEDGITVAKKLRDQFQEAHIIFYTSRLDKAYDAINTYVEPLSYIYKGDPHVRDILKNAITKVTSQNDEAHDHTFRLKDINGDKVFLKHSDVYYITTDEMRQKYVRLYLQDGTVKVKSILKDFLNISDDFVQVSRSCIVNKTKIQYVKKTHSSRVKKIITTRPNDEVDGNCYLSDKYKNNLV